MKKEARSGIRPIWLMKALLLSYAMTSILLVLLAFLLYKFDLDEQKVRIGITAIYVLSTFAGGFLMGKITRVKRFAWGACLGVLYFLLLVMISLGVYRTLSGGVNTILVFVLCIAGGMLGGMLSS